MQIVDHKVPPSTCLNCGEDLDGAAGICGPERPSPGDVSICAHCANVAIFTDDLKLRTPELHEGKNLARELRLPITYLVSERRFAVRTTGS